MGYATMCLSVVLAFCNQLEPILLFTARRKQINVDTKATVEETNGKVHAEISPA